MCRLLCPERGAQVLRAPAVAGRTVAKLSRMAGQVSDTGEESVDRGIRAALEGLGAGVPEGVGALAGVTHDSRRAGPGVVFVAVPGFKRDGLDFAPEAVRRGSPLVVAERDPGDLGAPVAVVPDAREALARLAREAHGRPSDSLLVYGITGTNGKTTTSYALYRILREAFGEEKCGLMTTAETIVGGERTQSVRTTPESMEVQETLAKMREAGVERVVMEVSSHGVSLKRVLGVRFSGALFTNLTRDHLDLHGTMEEYYRAKRGLFYMTEPGAPKLANAEDGWGRRLAREVGGVRTFGVHPEADYRVEAVRPAAGGTEFTLWHPEGRVELSTPLLGAYNVANVAGAASLALAAGVGESEVVRAVGAMEQVPGRFERVSGVEGFEVIVDYAHTDVGLRAVLEVARGVARGRVICAFGAAGERDAAKRPLMGKVASQLADVCIVTTDDAYGESPEKIAREVASGIRPGSEARVIIDRREAIEAAIREARFGDVVVIAGKGHERVQHLPEGDVPFHDASVAREVLEELASGRASGRR